MCDQNSQIETPLDIALNDSNVYTVGRCIVHTKYFQDSGLAWPNKRRRVHIVPTVARPSACLGTYISVDVVRRPAVTDTTGNSPCRSQEGSESEDEEDKMLAAMGLPSSFAAPRGNRMVLHPAHFKRDVTSKSDTNLDEPQQEEQQHWQQAIDPATGLYYYYCEATQQTQWEPPETGLILPCYNSIDATANRDYIEHVDYLNEDLKKVSRRSPYELAVESYMQHHGWFDDNSITYNKESENGIASAAAEHAEVRVQGEWIEEHYPSTNGNVPRGIAYNGQDAKGQQQEEPRRKVLKPRMETTGLMPRIPEPSGVHLRFEYEDQQQEQEEGQAGAYTNNTNSNSSSGGGHSAVLASGGDASQLVDDMQQLDVNSGIHQIESTLNKNSRKKKKKNRKKKSHRARKSSSRPADLPAYLDKYWMQRYSLFSRFDEGIVMDEEAWFSVTPEIIAWHQSKRMACGGCTITNDSASKDFITDTDDIDQGAEQGGKDDEDDDVDVKEMESLRSSISVAIDAFGGVGGNTIQLALTFDKVITCELDPGRMEMLQHNAQVYGVEQKVDYLAGDFFKLAPTIKGDVALLSPPWGGPQYQTAISYDPENMSDQGFQLSNLLNIAFNVMGCTGVVAWLPRNTSLQQLEGCLPAGHAFCEVERSVLNGVFKGVSVYYGSLARDPRNKQRRAV